MKYIFICKVGHMTVRAKEDYRCCDRSDPYDGATGTCHREVFRWHAVEDTRDAVLAAEAAPPLPSVDDPPHSHTEENNKKHAADEIDFHVYLWRDSVEKLDALMVEMGAATRAEALHAVIKASDGLVQMDDGGPAVAEEDVPTVSRFMKVRFGTSTRGCPKPG